ncbi:phosphoribosylglycinamide formyltransferase [Wenzhouxiangella sp. XN201]|uniref:phosphoribosylglycinamide formyltransferase n=1 Tax=Wenzhouxiangella sp. XN201 TaxID=2710755 RepID=UPI0013C85E91|nr:phosphoribosylglycinamide formyltransferase [Wenzhouxiangella sp. XN201]NEZ03266.1 phosphoribosylglycinamide formyltransferase [Wenzhouxiangella sp. XN201]
MAAEPARLVVLISGRGSNLQAIQAAIEAGRLPARIAAVVSDRPQAAGLNHAARHGLDTVMIEPARFPDRSAFERALMTAIDGFDPRFIVLAGFMRVLGRELVQHYLGRMLNIHPSLLPRHRGLHTHRRVLDAGEHEHGASVHFVTPDLDAGPVISQARVAVRPGDTADALAERLLPLEHLLYPATLALLLKHRVELHHDSTHLDDTPLRQPLLLDRDLGRDGGLLDAGHGR